jgi:hypothetical protein
MVIPEKAQLNQLHRNLPRFEACGLYTMHGGFQWAAAESDSYGPMKLDRMRTNGSKGMTISTKIKT